MIFHHIGVAVPSISDALKCMPGEVAQLKLLVHDSNQNVDLALYSWNGLTIELIEGNGELNKRSEFNMYHVCFQVDDVEEAVRAAVREGAIEIKPPLAAKLFNGRRVAFVMDRNGSVVEFLEFGKYNG